MCFPAWLASGPAHSLPASRSRPGGDKEWSYVTGDALIEKGFQRVFVRVPEGFDVKEWAAGQLAASEGRTVRLRRRRVDAAVL